MLLKGAYGGFEWLHGLLEKKPAHLSSNKKTFRLHLPKAKGFTQLRRATPKNEVLQLSMAYNVLSVLGVKALKGRYTLARPYRPSLYTSPKNEVLHPSMAYNVLSCWECKP